MKKLLILSFIFIPFLIFAQDFDEEFLDSLPDTVREDVLDKIDAKKELDKPIYRRASTKIDKIEKDEEKEEDDDQNFLIRYNLLLCQ